MSLEAIAQGQLDAYNAQDLDAFVAFYADDIIVANVGGAVTCEGIAAYRELYKGVFAKFPNNTAALRNRIVLAGSVIDHEYVERGDGMTAPFEVAAIYTIRDGKIARVEFAR